MLLHFYCVTFIEICRTGKCSK